MDIFKIISMKMEVLTKRFLVDTNFIEEKIYTILNYIKYEIIYETKELNMKNCTSLIAENIIGNERLKELIIKNMEKQVQSIKGLINEVFTSDVIEVNDVDFFEVIYSKLNNYFCLYLLNIIFYATEKSQADFIRIAQAYFKLTRKTILQTVEKQFSGDCKEALIGIIYAMISPAEYFAKKVYKAVKGLGTDNNTLIRILITRDEKDMPQIKQFFKHLYKKDMLDAVKDDTSGNYQKILYELAFH